ncbi:hypothetical protein T484DRAFT_1769096, partial [Baffinella frigidus]
MYEVPDGGAAGAKLVEEEAAKVALDKADAVALDKAEADGEPGVRKREAAAVALDKAEADAAPEGPGVWKREDAKVEEEAPPAKRARRACVVAAASPAGAGGKGKGKAPVAGGKGNASGGGKGKGKGKGKRQTGWGDKVGRGEPGVLDEDTGVRMVRLSNGVACNYKHTTFDAGQVFVRIQSRTGALSEGVPGGGVVGEMVVSLDTLMDSGLGEHSAQDVERWLFLNAITVESSDVERWLFLNTITVESSDVERWLFLNAITVESTVTLERLTLTMSVSATEGGLAKALQALTLERLTVTMSVSATEGGFAHLVLSSPRFDPDAFARTLKDNEIEDEHRCMSLASKTWTTLMLDAMGGDARFQPLGRDKLGAIDREKASQALLAALVPHRLEVTVVGDYAETGQYVYKTYIKAVLAALDPHRLEVTVVGDYAETGQELEDLLLLYLGTVASPLPADHPSLQHAAQVLHDRHHPARRLPIAAMLPHSAPTRDPKQWTLSLKTVTLPDEEPRAVINMCFRTIGYYGQEGQGKFLSAGGNVRLSRAFFVLTKVLDNRMHDQLREKLGLGY